MLRSVKEHHLFAKGKEVKQAVLERLMAESEGLLKCTDGVVATLEPSQTVLTRSAVATLRPMREVADQLLS